MGWLLGAFALVGGALGLFDSLKDDEDAENLLT